MKMDRNEYDTEIWISSERGTIVTLSTNNKFYVRFTWEKIRECRLKKVKLSGTYWVEFYWKFHTVPLRKWIGL